MRRNKGSGKKNWIDPDDAPQLTREFFRSADVYKGDRLLRRGRPPAGARPKEAVKLRISPDVLDYFRAGGPGWQTRINTTLERAVSQEKKRSKASKIHNSGASACAARSALRKSPRG